MRWRAAAVGHGAGVDESIKGVGVIGAGGFLGTATTAELAAGGWRVVGFSRRPAAAKTTVAVAEWRDSAELALDGLAAVVNLAGESIDRRWTDANRKLFRESRVGVTQRIVAALGRMPPERRPRVLVNASAVGIYGDRGDELLDEVATTGGGFLPSLCEEWEGAAAAAEPLGVRVVRVRIGVVLGRNGGAFERMLRVFSLGLGGRFGSGRQWMPWIHVADLARVFAAAVSGDQWRGPLNATAPAPERNAAFTAKLAAAVHRPAPLAVPGFALKLLLDGFGGVLLESQRSVPAALLADGFQFRFPTLEAALADLLGRRG